MKIAGKQWVKLYVDESDSFSRLPMTARAFGAYFLKMAARHDGGFTLDRLVRFYGATKHDREILTRMVLPALVADGYLVQDGDRYIVRNFSVAQSQSKRAVSARGVCDTTASGQADRSKPAASGQSASSARDDSKDDPSESEIEEKRGEEIRSAPKTSEIGTVHWIVRRFDLQWCEVYNHAFRTSRGTRERAEISKWLLENEALPLQRIWADFDAIVGRYLANKKDSLVKNQHPIVWLLQDLQAYDKPQAPRPRSRSSADDIAKLEALR